LSAVELNYVRFVLFLTYHFDCKRIIDEDHLERN
jgi:hypothetical protein